MSIDCGRLFPFLVLIISNLVPLIFQPQYRSIIGYHHHHHHHHHHQHQPTMSTSRLIQKVLQRPTNPSILPIPSTKTGNNVPKSLHKTRRTWRANTTRFDLPSPVLFGASNLILAEEKEGLGVSSTSLSLTNKEGRLPEIKGVKMQTRRIKDVDKAGGLEGMLVSGFPLPYLPRRVSSNLLAERFCCKDVIRPPQRKR